MLKKFFVSMGLILFFLSLNIGIVPARHIERKRSTDGTGPEHWIISFVNKCDKQQEVTIRYKNMEKNWITKGWFVLKPETGTIELKSIEPIFYIYFRKYKDDKEPITAVEGRAFNVSDDEDFEFADGKFVKGGKVNVRVESFNELSADQDYVYTCVH